MSKQHSKSRKRIAVLTYGYLAALVAVCWLLHCGDDSTFGTLIMFGPRWPWTLPWVVLAPIALCRYRFAVPIGLAAMLLTGPILGGNIPSPRTERGGTAVRVLNFNTWNGHGVNDRFRQVLFENDPDVVVLQEWRGDVALDMSGLPGEWRSEGVGDTVIATRFPAARIAALSYPELGSRGSALALRVQFPQGTATVVGLHLLSAREGLEALLHGRWRGWGELSRSSVRRSEESAIVRTWIDSLPRPTLIAGDFNQPPESAIFRRDWGEFGDAHATAGWGWGYTWHSRWHGLRIDHCLGSPEWACRKCFVGPNVGSDHRPLVSDWILRPS